MRFVKTQVFVPHVILLLNHHGRADDQGDRCGVLQNDQGARERVAPANARFPFHGRNGLKPRQDPGGITAGDEPDSAEQDQQNPPVFKIRKGQLSMYKFVEQGQKHFGK